MNVDTREIKPIEDLTQEERASGRWREIPADVAPEPPRNRHERRAAESIARREARAS